MQGQEEKLLTVKEFAAAAGVTTQSVYAACKGRLQPFCKQVDKKTLILASGLQFYQNSNGGASPGLDENSLQTNCNLDLQAEIAKLQGELQSCKAVSAEREQLIAAYKEEVLTLSDGLSNLHQQLTMKDAQISELTALLQAAQQSTQAALQAAGQAQIIAYQGQQNATKSHTDGLIARIFSRFKR